MIVFVAGRKIVAIRDKKAMISRREVMVSGVNENRVPLRSLGNVGAGYRLAISLNMTALTASRRIHPAAARLMGMALGQEGQENKRTEDCGSC